MATRLPRFLPIAALIVAGASQPATAQGSPTGCDRGCLHSVMDGYFAALFKHDPAAAPLARTFRSTENAITIPVGEGAWRSISGYGAVQRRYFDPATGQAAYFGLVIDHGVPAIASLRLKVEHRQVTEAEFTLARKGAGGLFSVDGLVANPPPEGPLPRSERAPRVAMIAAADAYFSGVQAHDDAADVPHIAGCERIENGVRVTNHKPGDRPPADLQAVPPGGGPAGAGGPPPGMPGMAQERASGDCVSNFGNFEHMIAVAAHRRYPLVDEEQGIVLSMTIFQRPPGVAMKRNLLTEYFAERGGKLSFVFAAMYYLDPSAPDSPGWPVP